MFKKITSGAVTFLLVASPLFVSAQALPSIPVNPTLEQLQTLVLQLTQLLAYLIGQQHQNTPTFSASPSVGSAPLQTTFSIYSQNQQGYIIDYGDGVLENLSGYSIVECSRGSLSCPSRIAPHTYTAPGTYYAKLSRIPGPTEGNCYGYECQVVGRATVYVTGTTTSSNIRVTAPNGGENWELGVTNSVTWTPYQYNPDINPSKDVTAYLERKSDACDYKYGCYANLGQVEESGKASIHWITGDLNSQHGTFSQIGTGQYYIRVVNNVTGAWDRSDAPFNIIARPVDVKVNGSDGPVTLTDNQQVTVSWSSTGGRTSCSLSGVRTTPNGNNYIDNVPPSGSSTYYAAIYPGWSSNTISANCRVGQDYSTAVYDTVAVNAQPGSTATLQIVSPNGGEKIDPMKQMDVIYNYSGLSKFSAALYRNDQWSTWIVKDQPVPGNIQSSLSWVPGNTLPIPSNDGAIYKIYMTGQKADGSGYVDDKSDAPFSFVSNSQPTLTVTDPVKLNTYAIGDGMNIKWNDTDAQSSTRSYYITLWGYDASKCSTGSCSSGSGWPVAGSGYSLADAHNGAFNWTVTTNVAPGTYIVRVCELGVPVCGESGPITITSKVIFSCPMYTFPLCPAGQHDVMGTPSVDSRGCTIPNHSCAPNVVTVPATCTYGSSTINIEGGSDACRSWCLSIQAESPFGTKYTWGQCVYHDANGTRIMDQTNTCTFGSTPVGGMCGGLLHCQVGVYGDTWSQDKVCPAVAQSPDKGTNFASALIAIEAALKAILLQLGK